jgi:hypothetical protein
MTKFRGPLSLKANLWRGNFASILQHHGWTKTWCNTEITSHGLHPNLRSAANAKRRRHTQEYNYHNKSHDSV